MDAIKIAIFLMTVLIPMGNPKEDIGDIERDTKALEFYLQVVVSAMSLFFLKTVSKVP